MNLSLSLKRPLGAALVFSLLFGMPGPGFYQAFAQERGRPVEAPVLAASPINIAAPAIPVGVSAAGLDAQALKGLSIGAPAAAPRLAPSADHAASAASAQLVRGAVERQSAAASALRADVSFFPSVRALPAAAVARSAALQGAQRLLDQGRMPSSDANRSLSEGRRVFDLSGAVLSADEPGPSDGKTVATEGSTGVEKPTNGSASDTKEPSAGREGGSAATPVQPPPAPSAAASRFETATRRADVYLSGVAVALGYFATYAAAASGAAGYLFPAASVLASVGLGRLIANVSDVRGAPRTYARAAAMGAVAVAAALSPLSIPGAVHPALSLSLLLADAAAAAAAYRISPSSLRETVSQLPRSMWGLMIGSHWLIILGINMHALSQPFLVLGLTGSRAMVGLIRNIHYGSYTMATFLPIGPTVASTDLKTLLIGTALMRSFLMGAIPLLYLTHHLFFASLAFIVAVNPVFQNMLTTSDATFKRLALGTDKKKVKEGTALMAKADSVAGLAIPFIAGYVVSALVLKFGNPGGYAMAYAGYSALLLLAVPFFYFLADDPRQTNPEITEKPSRGFLNVFLPMTTALKGLIYVSGVTPAYREFAGLPSGLYRDLSVGHGRLIAAVVVGVVTPFLFVKAFLDVWAERLRGPSRALLRAAGLARPLIAARDYYRGYRDAKSNIVSFGPRPAGDAGFRPKHAPWAVRLVFAGLVLTAPLWLVAGMLRVWASRLRAAGTFLAGTLRRRSPGSASGAPDANAGSGEVRVGRREQLARYFDKIPTVSGLADILRSDVLSILVGIGAIEMFMSDALSFVVLPTYILDVVAPRLDLAWIPLLGTMVSTPAGIFTLMSIASAVGAYLGAHWIEGEKGDERLKRLGHTSLYRAAAIGSLLFGMLLLPLLWMPSPAVQAMLHQGYAMMKVASTAAAGKAMVLKALGMIPVWKFAATIGVVGFMQFARTLLHMPLGIAMSSVQYSEMPDARAGQISAAFQMIDVALMGVGSLTLGIVIDKLSLGMGLGVVVAGIWITAVMEWIAPRWLQKANAKGWENGTAPVNPVSSLKAAASRLRGGKTAEKDASRKDGPTARLFTAPDLAFA